MSKYVTRAGQQEFDENPWINDLSMTIKKGSQITAMGRSSKLIDASSGELLSSDVAMVSKKIIDKEEFIKVFENGISNIFDLSKAARDLFRIILKIYLDQKMVGERVYLSDKTLSDAGYNRTRVTKNNALNQLMEAGFIAKVAKENNWFFINPNMFYKGNRLTLIEQYAIKGTDEADKMLEEQLKLEGSSK